MTSNQILSLEAYFGISFEGWSQDAIKVMMERMKREKLDSELKELKDIPKGALAETWERIQHNSDHSWHLRKGTLERHLNLLSRQYRRQPKGEPIILAKAIELSPNKSNLQAISEIDLD